MSFKIQAGVAPEKKADIIKAAADVLEKSQAIYMFTPPNRVGMPQFFGLYRKTLHVTRTINPGGFQPFEKHADRTLALAVAILVTDEKGPSKQESKWLEWAQARGIVCHVIKTWAEFQHALGELADI